MNNERGITTFQADNTEPVLYCTICGTDETTGCNCQQDIVNYSINQIEIAIDDIDKINITNIIVTELQGKTFLLSKHLLQDGMELVELVGISIEFLTKHLQVKRINQDLKLYSVDFTEFNILKSNGVLMESSMNN